MLKCFFSGLNSYGEWAPTTSERLTEDEKKDIEYVEIIEGQYGPTAMLVYKSTKRVKLVPMDDACWKYPVGTRLDVNSVVFQHYSDGTGVSIRCIANPVV